MDARLIDHDTIVFDIGGVLLSFSPERIARELLPEDTRDRVFSAMYGEDWQWGRFDLGADPNEVIAEEIAARAGGGPIREQILSVLDRFHLCMDPLPLTKELEELKRQGKKMYLLTNYPQPSLSNAMRRFDFFRLFDGCVCSSEEKCVKPGEEIFRVLIDRYGIEPEKTLFIDDNAPNTAQAARLGFDTWTYRAEE